MNDMKRSALVFGATGNVGGAAARELLRRGWHVRAVTRSPQGEMARSLAAQGAEIVQADMDDRASLEAAFAGMERVFSVQNWMTGGVDGEVRQGKLVADVAQAASVKHLVYGSAGIGVAGTGIPHFDSKVIVEAYMRDMGLPVTVVRPGPFMELMTDKAFYPALAAWGAMPKVVGWELPVPWVAVQDIGVAIANIFERPDEWIGRTINFYGDVQSLADCRSAFAQGTGKKPRGIPLPLALFQKMAGPEMVQMWRWMVDWSGNGGPAQLDADLAASQALHPDTLTVEQWVLARRNGHGAP
ncbi:MAG: NmrA/HSCARG family protein [Caldilinea sp.]|nr:NmrA/HSCARG family protein [Caldilinea sp.]